MFKKSLNSSQHRGNVAATWLTLRASYRFVNIASHHVLGALLKMIVAFYFIFALLLLALRYVVLPNIDHYKSDIERIATRAVGSPVSIARVYGSWNGFKPSLFLGDVVVRDKDGRQALRLPSVSATLSWWSVVTSNLQFDLLEISRPDLDIRRDVSGKLTVAGISVDLDKGGDGKGLDWILSQQEILIHEGRLRWTDDRRRAPELVLDGVNLLLHNQWRRHQFALRATPPAAFSSPIDVRADFVHPYFHPKISNMGLWKGELFVDVPETDLSVWKSYFDYPFEISKGKGSVRAWLELDHAKLANFTADLTLSTVVARLGKSLQPLSLSRVNGRISAREDFEANKEDDKPTFGTHGHVLALTDFSMADNEGLILSAASISEKFVAANNGKPEKMEIKAQQLELQTLVNFVERLPLSAAQRQLLVDFSPRGRLKEFSAQWSGTYPNIESYNVTSQFADLSMKPQSARPARPKNGKIPAQAAVPAIPGFDNLTGRVDANDHGGSFSLDSTNLKLHLPSYFTDPLMLFDQLKMQASWDFKDRDYVLFQVKKMDVVQQGLIASFSGSHLLPLNSQQGKSLGIIDLTGNISVFDVKTVGHYLPLHTPEHLRTWLTGALEDGAAHDVVLKLKGELAQFPFQPKTAGEKSSGEFSIHGKIDNGKLNYVPGIFAKDGKSVLWPQAEEIQGSFLFDRTRMEIKAETAKTHAAFLSNVTAIIPDMLSSDMQLEIDGNASAPLQTFVDYVGVSPVLGWIANFTEETKASGNAKLALKLQLPLARIHDAKVQGSLQLFNDEVTLQKSIPLLSAANGKLEFNEKGFNLNGLRAVFLGGAVALSGGTQRDNTIQIKATGSITSEGLHKTYPTLAMQRLADHMSGGASYSASIGVKKGHPDILVESTLQGLELAFPVPLRKAANDIWPLKFQLTGLSSDDAMGVRDEMKLSLGAMISARYLRQKSLAKNDSWHVISGGIGVNVPAPEPDSGLIVNVDMKSLNVDVWRSLVSSLTASDHVGRSASDPGSERKADTVDSLNIAQYIDPEVLAARATELLIVGKKLNNVVVGASHQKGVWQANIDSLQTAGYITWNEVQGGQAQGLGKVTARLSSLIIPPSAASDVNELLEGKNAATQIPALDVVADNFELFDKKLGRLEIVASNTPASAVREWNISKLSLSNPDAELNATGKWSTKLGVGTTSLSYTLEMENAGKLLERFGFASILKNGKGKMEGEVSWDGLPYAIDIPSLTGQIKLDMAAGRFPKVEPGAAKLLAVLSLQALPRRLTLDFRDVFSEGFSFDGITATAKINKGVVKTDNLKMRSVNATVVIDGTADIAQETQNLHVAVIPEVNAGAASVVYALAINPVIGFGTFLAQLFLRDPLMRAFTFEYQITGSWKDPTVTKLEHKSNKLSPLKSDVTEIPAQ